jgi:ketosteroid isomerase-like protein
MLPEKPTGNFGQAASSLQRAAAERSAEPAEHLRWIQTQIEAIERGDFDSVMRDAHEDVTLDIFAPPHFPFVTRARGKPELLAAILHNFGAVQEQTPHIQDIFAEGQTVVLFGRERGKIRSTGVPYDVEFVERLTFKDGRLASARIVVAESERK